MFFVSDDETRRDEEDLNECKICARYQGCELIYKPGCPEFKNMLKEDFDLSEKLLVLKRLEKAGFSHEHILNLSIVQLLELESTWFREEEKEEDKT